MPMQKQTSPLPHALGVAQPFARSASPSSALPPPLAQNNSFNIPAAIPLGHRQGASQGRPSIKLVASPQQKSPFRDARLLRNNETMKELDRRCPESPDSDDGDFANPWLAA